MPEGCPLPSMRDTLAQCPPPRPIAIVAGPAEYVGPFINANLCNLEQTALRRLPALRQGRRMDARSTLAAVLLGALQVDRCRRVGERGLPISRRR